MSTRWHVACLRGVMGDWIFYPALLKAEQISKYIMSSKDIREAKALDDYLQHDLKPRVSKIVTYLNKCDTRFFGSIILGVFDALPNWIEFNLSGVAKKHDLSEISDAESSLGLMEFHGNEKMFAIDGQHRVEAIKQAFAKFSERIQDDQYPVIFVAHLDDKPGKVRTRRLFSDRRWCTNRQGREHLLKHAYEEDAVSGAQLGRVERGVGEPGESDTVGR